MNANEERSLIERAQQGDEDAVGALVAEHGGFVRTQANRLWRRRRCVLNRKGLDRDDLHQEALLGFLMGIQHFNPDCPVRLLTYAGYWIQWRMTALIDKGELMVPLTGEMRERLAREAASRLDGHDELADRLRFLSPRMQAVLRLSYGIGAPASLKDEEVAARLGVSRSRVSQLVHTALEKLERGARAEKE